MRIGLFCESCHEIIIDGLVGSDSSFFFNAGFHKNHTILIRMYENIPLGYRMKFEAKKKQMVEQ